MGVTDINDDDTVTVTLDVPGWIVKRLHGGDVDVTLAGSWLAGAVWNELKNRGD